MNLWAGILSFDPSGTRVGMEIVRVTWNGLYSMNILDCPLDSFARSPVNMLLKQSAPDIKKNDANFFSLFFLFSSASASGLEKDRNYLIDYLSNVIR